MLATAAGSAAATSSGGHGATLARGDRPADAVHVRRDGREPGGVVRGRAARAPRGARAASRANPASTSPDPAVASSAGAEAATYAAPSGEATTVDEPLSSTTAREVRGERAHRSDAVRPDRRAREPRELPRVRGQHRDAGPRDDGGAHVGVVGHQDRERVGVEHQRHVERHGVEHGEACVLVETASRADDPALRAPGVRRPGPGVATTSGQCATTCSCACPTYRT